jgi:hypothetical protein
LIQPLRSPTSCAAKPGTAYGPSNFGIRVYTHNPSTHEGGPVSLRFILREARVFSFQFL